MELMRRADEVQGEKEIGWDEGLWLLRIMCDCCVLCYCVLVDACDMDHVSQMHVSMSAVFCCLSHLATCSCAVGRQQVITLLPVTTVLSCFLS